MDQIMAIKLGVLTFTVGVCVSLSAVFGCMPELFAETVFYLGLLAGFFGLGIAAVATEEEYLWRNGKRVPAWKC